MGHELFGDPYIIFYLKIKQYVAFLVLKMVKGKIILFGHRRISPIVLR